MYFVGVASPRPHNGVKARGGRDNESGVFGIEDKIPSSQKHLSGCRYDCCVHVGEANEGEQEQKPPLAMLIVVVFGCS